MAHSLVATKPVYSEGVMIALVDVELPGKAVRVNISLEESLLKWRETRAGQAATYSCN